MSPEQELELARMRLELMRVTTAKAEMQFNIMKLRSEITRMETNIAVQAAKEVELTTKLADLVQEK